MYRPRFTDLLDQLHKEYETLLLENSALKSHITELEEKSTFQLQEIKKTQTYIKELNLYIKNLKRVPSFDHPKNENLRVRKMGADWVFESDSEFIDVRLKFKFTVQGSRCLMSDEFLVVGSGGTVVICDYVGLYVVRRDFIEAYAYDKKRLEDGAFDKKRLDDGVVRRDAFDLKRGEDGALRREYNEGFDKKRLDDGVVRRDAFDLKRGEDGAVRRDFIEAYDKKRNEDGFPRRDFMEGFDKKRIEDGAVRRDFIEAYDKKSEANDKKRGEDGAVEFCLAGHFLYTAGEKLIKKWDLKRRILIKKINVKDDVVCIKNHEHLIICLCKDNYLRVFEEDRVKEIFLKGKGHFLSMAVFDFKAYVSCSDRRIFVVDLKNDDVLQAQGQKNLHWIDYRNYLAGGSDDVGIYRIKNDLELVNTFKVKMMNGAFLREDVVIGGGMDVKIVGERGVGVLSGIGDVNDVGVYGNLFCTVGDGKVRVWEYEILN